MYCNDKVWLYLKSLDYKKVQYSCARFTTINNGFSETGNVISKIIKIYIPLEEMNGETVQISEDVDYVYCGDDPVDIELNEYGEMDPTDLLLAGGKVITATSKKDYGSKHMQHYYIQAE